MAKRMVQYNEVSKIYEKTMLKALEPVSFEVEENEFVSIVGTSGCGKSTLLKITSGLIGYTSGELLVNGHKVSGPTIETGMVFQTPSLFKWRSVIDNIMFPIEIMHQNKKAAKDRAREIISKLGLAGFENVYPFQLSGGMQHRVALGRVLMYNPLIFLMDEPFSSLDALTRDQLDIELAQICEVGKTVEFVTHSIPEAVLLSDRVVVMTPRPGRVKTIFDIDLPRPRTDETRRHPKFATYTQQIRDQLELN